MDYNSDFEYAWRFTEEKYNKLCISDLNKIEVLTQKQSLDFWNKNIIDKISYYPIQSIVNNNEIIIDDCGWGDINTENDTKKILMDLLSDIKEIFVLWGPKHAVKLQSYIFIKYWSDFCYCSDSGNIVYAQPDKIYIYHEDILLKAKIK